MNNNNSQQLIDNYMKKCGYLYPERNIYSSQNVHISEIGTVKEFGFINLMIITGSEQTPLSNAAITVYVNQGGNFETPIMYLYSTLNPILIPLPVSLTNIPDTLIRGPEYYYSTYNLRVDAIGYYSTRILNIRLFPGITTDFNVSMIPIAQSGDISNHEQIINIPPHPRDKVIDEILNLTN